MDTRLKYTKWIYTGIIVMLTLCTWGITLWAKKNPEGVEKLYSSTVYPYVAKGIGRIMGVVPISLGELIVFALIMTMVIGVVVAVIKPSVLIMNISTIFHWAIRVIGLSYIIFYFIWGFNYYRQDYMDLAGMSHERGTIEDLKALSLEVITKANNIRHGLAEDEEGIFIIEEDFQVLVELAKEGFDNFNVGDVSLSGDYGRAKPLLISKWMSYTGITGIYFPYTAEANVNVDIPHTNIPATICHEIGHQRGFAKEEEANFIAYWASINNPHEQFQYSGYYLALQYLMSDIYKTDRDLYDLLSLEISDAVKRDIDHEYDYWKMREGRAEEVATTLNDNYLKANNQGQGVQSYNGVVKLLLSEYKSR